MYEYDFKFFIAIVWLTKAILLMIVTVILYLPRKFIDTMKQDKGSNGLREEKEQKKW